MRPVFFPPRRIRGGLPATEEARLPKQVEGPFYPSLLYKCNHTLDPPLSSTMKYRIANASPATLHEIIFENGVYHPRTSVTSYK